MSEDMQLRQDQLALLSLQNETEMEEAKFRGITENVIDITRNNNRILGLQGETIN